jgi:TolB protein
MHSATPLKVVFERVKSAGNSDVIVTDETGRAQKNLTAKSLTNDASPSFGPRGGSIVFTSDRKGKFALWIMDSNGGRQRLLTPSGGSDVNPSYSPDGKWIVFTCNAHGNADICIVTSKGTGRRNLTHDAATELDATWSLDSKRIVFDRIDEAGESDIWSVNPKGSGLKNLTPGSELGELDPTLSKSGELAFDAIDQNGNYDIYVLKPGATQATRLTDDPAEDSAPVYSPDGKKLLFVSARTGEYEIFEMTADGADQRNVSRDPTAANIAPNFAPTTTRILAAANRLTLPAAAFPCALYGTTGNDDGVDHPVLNGNGNANRICGRSGKDIIHGWGLGDLIDGGSGKDTMYGDSGSDTIYARAGVLPDSDSIWGGTGSDTAIYDPDNDSHDPHDTCHSDVEYCRTTA